MLDSETRLLDNMSRELYGRRMPDTPATYLARYTVNDRGARRLAVLTSRDDDAMTLTTYDVPPATDPIELLYDAGWRLPRPGFDLTDSQHAEFDIEVADWRLVLDALTGAKTAADTAWNRAVADAMRAPGGTGEKAARAAAAGISTSRAYQIRNGTRR